MVPVYLENLGFKRIGEHIARNENGKRKLSHDGHRWHNWPDQRRCMLGNNEKPLPRREG